MKVFTQKRFAKEMGFTNAGSREFHRFRDKAIKLGFIKVQQSGFMAHSSAHPKLVIQSKEIIDPINFIFSVASVPFWAQREVNGYRLTMCRTGLRRPLRDGTFSKIKWWKCEDCGEKIPVGKPYAARVHSSMLNTPQPKGRFPVFVKCVACYLHLLEQDGLANLGD